MRSPATFLAILVLGAALPPADVTLIGRAILPSATFAPGPPRGK